MAWLPKKDLLTAHHLRITKAKKGNLFLFIYEWRSVNSAFGGRMSRARAALVVISDVILVAVVALILEVDQIINVTLYNYGLVFSNDWAQPYWLMLRVAMVLIVASIIIISVVELPSPAFEEKTETESQRKRS
jgi:hypothetical protein